MARLSLYVPPFAGDYSGVCSALFGLDCLMVLVDANCCMRNYTEYDEPRWGSRRKSTFSAQLRTLEAVLGDDERIISQVVEAAEELRPACVALVGSPVPAITGMDLAGIACEVEARCGISCLGLDATGFETYEHGVSMALAALVKRYARGGAPTGAGDGANVGAPTGGEGFAAGEVTASAEMPAAAGEGANTAAYPPLRLNVLGLSPHDFASEEDMACLRRWLEDAGAELAFCPDDTYTLDDVARSGEADATLVVAWSGLEAATYLRDEFGVPMVVSRPLCAEDAKALVDSLCTGLRGTSCLSETRRDVANANPAETQTDEAEGPLLIVGEQIFAHALRGHARRLLGAGCPAVVGSFFAMEQQLMEPGDQYFAEEAALVRYAREHPAMAWIGDPLLARIPELAACPHLEIPHEAISSTLYEKARAKLAGENTLKALKEFLGGLEGRV